LRPDNFLAEERFVSDCNVAQAAALAVLHLAWLAQRMLLYRIPMFARHAGLCLPFNGILRIMPIRSGVLPRAKLTVSTGKAIEA